MATLFIYLSVCLFVHSFICLFIYLIILQLKTLVYHSDRQALFTAQFRRAGLLATANNCYINYFGTAGRNDIVFVIFVVVTGSLGSRVVSMQDSGAVGPGFKSQPRRCRVTVAGKLFTPIMPLFTKRRNR